MAEFLTSDDIDFSMYERESEGAHRVLPSSSFADAVVSHFHDKHIDRGARMPWKKAASFLSFRPGEVTAWNGFNGSGKSEVLGQISMGLLAQGKKVCKASLEMPPVRTLARMCRQASGVMVPGVDYIHDFHRRTDGGLWLYDKQGSVESGRILALLRYCAKEKGIQHFILDSLMKCGVAEYGQNAYEDQKRFVDALCEIADSTQMHIHLVTHSRKPDNESSVPGKYDIAGAKSIPDQVYNVINVWRNKPKERATEKGEAPPVNDPDCLLICDKQRNGDWEGRIALYLHKESHQFLEAPFAMPSDLLSLPNF